MSAAVLDGLPLRRRLLIGAGAVVTAAVIGASALWTVDAMAQHTARDRHAYRFAGSILDVDVTIGDLRIVPGQDGQITVDRTMAHGLRRPPIENRLVDDRFVVRDGNCVGPLIVSCRVRWRLEVPRGITVVARTTVGALRVSDLAGSLDLRTTTGRISVAGVLGRVVLGSDGGSLSATDVASEEVLANTERGGVSLTFVAAPRLVVATSTEGSVHVGLPAGTDSYQIRAKSEDAATTVTARSDSRARRIIRARSQTGDVRVVQVAER